VFRVSPAKKLGKAQAGGQKGRGLGEGILPACSAARSAAGVGSGSSLRQQGSKARKNCFLN